LGGNVSKQGENVMKKFVGLVLVLSLCLSATATAVDIHGLRVAPDDQKDHYQESDWITIELYLDMDNGDLANSFVLNSLQSDPMGEAANPQADSRWSIPTDGYLNNTGNTLVEWAAGSITGTDPDIDGVLWSVEYHVPDVDESTWIDIFALNDPGQWIEGKIYLSDGAGGTYPVEIQGMLIHVIPEPMTIALLGLGGLVAMRRRKR
jgi:hypothetical protein